MSFLATITVHRLRGRIAFATTVVMALSFAPASFTALDTFDSDLGSIHRLHMKPSFPLSPGISESSLLRSVLLIGVLKPTGCTLSAGTLLIGKTDL
jgi:hypothetical protein